MSEATRLIEAVGKGDARAAEALLPVVYDELRRLARGQMSNERPGHTLQATALVHEAYLRLMDGNEAREWDGRRHFFAAAAEAMRRILIDHARQKNALKRGGGRERVELRESPDGNDINAADALPAISSACDHVDDLLALNDALERLRHEDAEKAELVKLLYFASLSLEEAAAVLGISRTTAHRQWVFTRAWLCQAMGESWGERTGGTDQG